MQNLHVDCYHRENHAKPINGVYVERKHELIMSARVYTPHSQSIENPTIPDHLPNNKQSMPKQ